MKSWKTTLCGAVAAIGAYLKTIPEPSWLSTIGEIFVVVGTAGVGFFARDNSVSSEQAGVK